MAKQKATHNGTCQWCGARQAVDPVTGTLAKHGYTVRWGFFSGVCSGSDNVPYEKGFNLIERSIAAVKAQIVRVSEEATAVRNRTKDDGVWVGFYKPATWTDRSSGTVWKDVPNEAITVEVKSGRGYEGAEVYTWEVVTTPNPYAENSSRKTVSLNETLYGADKLDWRGANNRAYAAKLQRDNDKRDEYVAWQASRLASWEEKDLLPRK